MKLLIDIPKEFEQHFKADRFEDSLHRLSADAHLLAGLYEQETALMLIEVFKNATLVESISTADVVRGKWINDHNGKYSPLGDNFFCSGRYRT